MSKTEDEITLKDTRVEYIFIDDIAKWANPSWSPMTEDEENELRMSLEDSGVLDPLTLSVGICSRRIKIDEGNHRIWICPELKITKVPVIARVWNYCTFSNGNGDHSYDGDEIIKQEKEWLEKEYYCKPSDIIRKIQVASK